MDIVDAIKKMIRSAPDYADGAAVVRTARGQYDVIPCAVLIDAEHHYHGSRDVVVAYGGAGSGTRLSDAGIAELAEFLANL